MKILKKEQEDIINFDCGNILVSASAGSGKTFVMIERAVKLMADKKAHINEILIVTFTNAAAKDMKEKLKKALAEKATESNDKGLVEELRNLEMADVSTLHSFVGKLLRTYFFAVGISPDFSILDDADASQIKNDCINKVFKDFYDTKERWFKELVKIYSIGRKDNNLKELILKLYEFCNVEENPQRFAENFSAIYEKNNFEKSMAEYKNIIDEKLMKMSNKLTEIYNEFSTKSHKKGIDFCKSIKEVLDNLLKEPSVYGIKKYENIKLASPFSGERNADTKEARNAVKELSKDICSLISKVCENLSDYATDLDRCEDLKKRTDDLVKIMFAFGKEYAKEKAEENVLDFADLEHLTLQLFQNDDVLSAVRRKYKYVFADEYQDINSIQEKILSLISSDNLFMVGDVKQSIYGFRGCRPEIFARKFENMRKIGEKIAMLNFNFRSSKAIIDMVNTIFCYSMDKNLFGVDYKNEAMLKEGGIYGDGNGRAELHFLEEDKTVKKEEKPRIYDILEEIKNVKEEKDDLSALITKIVHEELNKEYYDVKEKRLKRVTLKDIAILTRNKENKFVSKLVSGLTKRGISVTSEVSVNVCEYPEVQGLIYALKLVDSFKDDIPLAITMLNPVGKFSEQDLTDMVVFDKQDSFYKSVENYLTNGKGELQERVKRFFDYYEKLRLFSDFNSVHDVLKKIVFDSGYENYILASHDGENKLRRVHRFIGASKKADGGYTLKEFLKRIENSSDAFKYSANGDENSVKIMTIHASKGLEFPVTILCGLERNMNMRDEVDKVLFDRELGIAVKYYDLNNKTVYGTPIRGYIKERLATERIKEELRLFYVAATRAMYSMHLIFAGKDDKRGSDVFDANKFIDYIPKTLPKTVHNSEEFDFINMGERGTVIIGKSDAKIDEILKQNFTFKYPYVCDTTLPIKTGVTAVFDKKIYNVQKFFSSESTDKEKGTVAHKIVEYFDFDRFDDFIGQVENLVQREILSEKEKNSVDLNKIKNALILGGLNKLKGKQLYKEKSFIADINANKLFETESKEKVLVQGVIDLLVVDGYKAEIIDYKYSVLNGESLKRKYGKQLAVYACAVETVLNKKVIGKKLVNLFTGESILT